ncbi:hypothetical protein P5673_009680 [Acropora cervicornis]|uniref:Uncharacterized protein n=1 Tax=Acropora cervicornis TaxID=6130 RepID=A0AAD9QRT3_ACRCE|nr:hypothetical protein P5673_009680 [Acropora cervicornis]
MAEEMPDEIEDIFRQRKVNKGFLNNKNLTCPAPKVIEFIEPGKEKAQVKVRRIQLKKKSPRKIPEDFDFRAIAREVTEFGMTGFSRSERKKYEDQKALSLVVLVTKLSGTKRTKDALSHVDAKDKKKKGTRKRATGRRLSKVDGWTIQQKDLTHQLENSKLVCSAYLKMILGGLRGQSSDD